MKKVTEFRSDFLFSNSDFITGMGSTLNLAGNYFEFASSENEIEADLKAIRSDWGSVGQDIKNAIVILFGKDSTQTFPKNSVCK